MKILGFNIGNNTESLSVENVEKKPKRRTKVIKTVIQREWTRTQQNVEKWRQQTIIAESKQNPQRVELYNIYRDVVLDAHLSGLITTLKVSVSSGDFFLVNSKGKDNDEAMESFSAPWFIQYLDYFVDAKMWGHSLIQIDEIKNNTFVFESLVPRENVVPEFGIVKANAWDYSTSGVEFRELPYKDWLIEIGKKTDLGLLHKATPYVLWKKGVLGSWSQFAELFGMPFRVGKTDILNPDNKKNMESMLANMAGAAWGVFNTDDTLEFVENSKGDAFKVFDEMIKMVNSELSKLILGQTGTTEEKAHVGAAQVHESVMHMYVTSIKNEIEQHINTVIIPLMQKHNMIGKDVRFKWDDSENLSIKESFEIVNKLLTHYKIDPEFINETFNIPVEEKADTEPPDINTEAIENIENLYRGLDG
jgi:phage gp29-like protein